MSRPYTSTLRPDSAISPTHPAAQASQTHGQLVYLTARPPPQNIQSRCMSVFSNTRGRPEPRWTPHSSYVHILQCSVEGALWRVSRGLARTSAVALKPWEVTLVNQVRADQRSSYSLLRVKELHDKRKPVSVPSTCLYLANNILLPST